MKKKDWVVCLIFIIVCTGCGKSSLNEVFGIKQTLSDKTLIQEKPILESEQLQENELQTSEKIESTQPISIEEVKRLSRLADLTLSEVYAYAELQKSGLGFAYYEFTYAGKEYQLDIYETAQGELEGVRLVDCETMLSIDIRTGNVEHLIENTVSMEDYFTLDLPEGLSVGAYDIYMMDFGGSRIDSDQTQDTELPCGKVRIVHAVEPVVVEGQLKDVSYANNNVYFQKKESLTQLPYPCLLTLMSVEESKDTTADWWGAYFAKEGCEDICYLVQFRADLFSKEEVIAILETITFSERAFGM